MNDTIKKPAQHMSRETGGLASAKTEPLSSSV